MAQRAPAEASALDTGAEAAGFLLVLDRQPPLPGAALPPGRGPARRRHAPDAVISHSFTNTRQHDHTDHKEV
ncbi:MAG: hypothetical protein ACJ8AW_25720 [Rhodopila sp.]